MALSPEDEQSLVSFVRLVEEMGLRPPYRREGERLFDADGKQFGFARADIGSDLIAILNDKHRGTMTEEEQRQRVMAAADLALKALPGAKGVVLISIMPKEGADPGDMQLRVASALRGRELAHHELQDLLRTVADMPEEGK